MKKYLFLLFLFLLYIILVAKKEDSKFVSYISDDTESVKTVTVKFENGINCKNLINDFNINADYYLVKSIELEGDTYSVNCNKIEECINDIYNQEEDSFSDKYIASGFKVNAITYLAYNPNDSTLSDDYLIYINK